MGLQAFSSLNVILYYFAILSTFIHSIYCKVSNLRKMKDRIESCIGHDHGYSIGSVSDKANDNLTKIHLKLSLSIL